MNRKEKQKPFHISNTMIMDYEEFLKQEERCTNTITKYVRDLQHFFSFLNGNALDKERLLDWKEDLLKNHTPVSVNSMLSAVNSFLEWQGQKNLKIKPLKIQRQIFLRPEKELTRAEYIRLVNTADRQNNPRLSLLLQTICATGIRVSELQSITVESLQTGRAGVACKGKNRIVFLPADLCRVLRRYCHKNAIRKGSIFCTKNGKPMDRSNIWKEMKSLCKSADVPPEKVFPHNLRHLFARTYYQIQKDISRLADLLGHSSINTTRIYTMESGSEHAKQLNGMGLVCTRT